MAEYKMVLTADTVQISLRLPKPLMHSILQRAVAGDKTRTAVILEALERDFASRSRKPAVTPQS